MKAQVSRLALATALTAIATTLLIGCNKAPETTTDAQASSTTVGTPMDDTLITTSVKSALLAEPAINSLDISVLTVKGEVQLSGFVDNQAQIDQATRIARATQGAGSVKNELRVKQ